MKKKILSMLLLTVMLASTAFSSFSTVLAAETASGDGERGTVVESGYTEEGYYYEVVKFAVSDNNDGGADRLRVSTVIDHTYVVKYYGMHKSWIPPSTYNFSGYIGGVVYRGTLNRVGYTIVYTPPGSDVGDFSVEYRGKVQGNS